MSNRRQHQPPLVFVFAVFLLLAGCGDNEQESDAAPDSANVTTPTATAIQRDQDGSDLTPVPQESPMVTIEETPATAEEASTATPVSSPTEDPQETEDSDEKDDSALRWVATGVDRTQGEDCPTCNEGEYRLVIRLALVNESESYVDLPELVRGIVTINESDEHTYVAHPQSAPSLRNDVNFQIPPGFAVCGLVDTVGFSEIERYSVVTRLPEAATVQEIDVSQDLPPFRIDDPEPNVCADTVTAIESNLPSLPVELDVPDESGEIVGTAQLNADYFDFTLKSGWALKAVAENHNDFEGWSVPIYNFWAIDHDGVVWLPINNVGGECYQRYFSISAPAGTTGESWGCIKGVQDGIRITHITLGPPFLYEDRLLRVDE